MLTDIVFMATVGMQPILVHGGGKSISAAMKKAGIEPRFVQGRRYTDERTLAIAEHVLVNEINKQIVKTISELGVPAMGLHSLSSCVLMAEQVRLDGPEGRQIDIGLVGNVTSVNAAPVAGAMRGGNNPGDRADCPGPRRRQAECQRRHGGGDGGRVGPMRQAGDDERYARNIRKSE